ncbi:MAG TPA: DUF4129 domain-containing protein, partial [Candidatus Thermoplasmatota archaeon]|nr:DUF4129 domain-containing protein [Candidatus Thermoplasmatota archaeon]
AAFPRGPAPLRASYAGDANRRASEETVIVDVVAPTSLRLKLPNRLDVGDSFTGTVVLVDDEGKPVPDAIIRVRFSGYPYPFTLKTNETGETSFPGKIVEAGQSEVEVRFAGGGPLLGATESSRIQVAAVGALRSEGRQWAAAIAGSLLAVAVASVALARWRRRQIREVRKWLYEAEAGLLAGDEYVATILTAYRRLTEHFVRYGYMPRPDVTSREFVDAARQALPVREGPILDLVQLFDEARYSQHPVGPMQRDAAVRALGAINRDLLQAGRERKGVPT